MMTIDSKWLGSWRIQVLVAAWMFVPLSAPLLALAEDRPAPEKIQGEVKYLPAENEQGIPERFKLAAHSFVYQGTRFPLDSQSIEIWELTFPSPVKTASALNNTVHCEYYRPKQLAAGKKVPAVI